MKAIFFLLVLCFQPASTNAAKIADILFKDSYNSLPAQLGGIGKNAAQGSCNKDNKVYTPEPIAKLVQNFNAEIEKWDSAYEDFSKNISCNHKLRAFNLFGNGKTELNKTAKSEFDQRRQDIINVSKQTNLALNEIMEKTAVLGTMKLPAPPASGEKKCDVALRNYFGTLSGLNSDFSIASNKISAISNLISRDRYAIREKLPKSIYEKMKEAYHDKRKLDSSCGASYEKSITVLMEQTQTLRQAHYKLYLEYLYPLLMNCQINHCIIQQQIENCSTFN